MLTINEEKDFLVLKGIHKNSENIHPLVNQEDGWVTFISEEKTFYLYMDVEKITCSRKLAKYLGAFIAANKHDITIDLCSFRCEKFRTLTTAIETILYVTHPSYSLKTEEKFKKQRAKQQALNYNISTEVCDAYHAAHPEVKTQEEIFCISRADEIENARIKMQYVNFARDLQDTPAEIGTQAYYAEKIKQEAEKISNLKVTILGQQEIEANKMNLLLSVNAGSPYEPKVVILEYNNNPDCENKLAIVGKGVCFDSGGYSLKPSPFMKGMKFDMSGAAIALGTGLAMAKAGLKTNFVAIGGFVENRIGSKANLPESIITSMNGKTVQIDNTDAEGRLVLADCLTYAIRKLNATHLIELSTLTGAVVYALGDKITGVWSTCNKFYEFFAQGACLSGEEFWRMPFHQFYDEIIAKTPVADISNIGDTRNGGASTAAAFLKNFTEDKPYIHLDIAGTASVDSKRGTGVMLRSLFEAVRLASNCKKSCDTKCENKVEGCNNE